MNRLKAMIVDDEKHCQITLSKLIEWTDEAVDIIACCDNVDMAKSMINKNPPDILFLDIQMPIKNGFDLLYELPEVNFDVVFTTAYDEFAVEAFNTNAFAYLLKPILEDQLKSTLQKIRKKQDSKFTQDKLITLYNSLTKGNTTRKIPIPTSEGIEFVHDSEIVRCEADGNYTVIYKLDNTTIFISKTLKQVEELLSGYQFIRPHNSHLINLAYIKSYHKGSGGSLVLEDGSIIPVSRYRKIAIQNLL